MHWLFQRVPAVLASLFRIPLAYLQRFKTFLLVLRVLVGLILSSQNKLMFGAEAGSGFTVFFYIVNSSWLLLNVPYR